MVEGLESQRVGFTSQSEHRQRQVVVGTPPRPLEDPRAHP